MSVTWHKPQDRLPEDGEECLLMPPDHGGMTTVPVFGPIPWHAQSGMWLDLFATPEAGTCIKTEQVALWTLWAPIQPPE